MATLRERDVFEYCENLFEKLKKDDGGYYPHKHDRMVFEQTAEHFSISEENVRKIYDSYTKLAAQISSRMAVAFSLTPCRAMSKSSSVKSSCRCR